MQSTVPWQYRITYTEKGFQCEDIPSIIFQEKRDQKGRTPARITARIRDLECQIERHHEAVRLAFEKIPTLVNQVKAMYALGITKEEKAEKRKKKQQTNADIRHKAQKKTAKNNADYAAWVAQQEEEEDGEDIGSEGGSDDMDDAYEEAQVTDDDVDPEHLDEEGQACFRDLERWMNFAPAPPHLLTRSNLKQLRAAYDKYLKAARAESLKRKAERAEEKKYSPEAMQTNPPTVTIRDEHSRTAPPSQPVHPAPIPALGAPPSQSVPSAPIPTLGAPPSQPAANVDQPAVNMDLADEEMKQAYERVQAEAAERKRKADAEEKLQQAEAYLRLAKLAKGKVEPKQFMGFSLPRFGG